MKRCAWCKEELDDTQFYTRKTGPRVGQRDCYCKTCRITVTRANCNTERQREYHRRWYYATLEQRRRYQHAYYQANAQRIRQQANRYYYAHREQILAQWRAKKAAQQSDDNAE